MKSLKTRYVDLNDEIVQWNKESAKKGLLFDENLRDWHRLQLLIEVDPKEYQYDILFKDEVTVDFTMELMNANLSLTHHIEDSDIKIYSDETKNLIVIHRNPLRTIEVLNKK